jgi:hypothetical protein
MKFVPVENIKAAKSYIANNFNVLNYNALWYYIIKHEILTHSLEVPRIHNSRIQLFKILRTVKFCMQALCAHALSLILHTLRVSRSAEAALAWQVVYSSLSISHYRECALCVHFHFPCSLSILYFYALSLGFSVWCKLLKLTCSNLEFNFYRLFYFLFS